MRNDDSSSDTSCCYVNKLYRCVKSISTRGLFASPNTKCTSNRVSAPPSNVILNIPVTLTEGMLYDLQRRRKFFLWSGQLSSSLPMKLSSLGYEVLNCLLILSSIFIRCAFFDCEIGSAARCAKLFSVMVFCGGGRIFFGM